MSFYVSFCTGAGEGIKKLEPARRWIDSIAGLLGRAKEVEDSLRPALPKYKGRRQLGAPKNEPPTPTAQVGDHDDETPF